MRILFSSSKQSRLLLCNIVTEHKNWLILQVIYGNLILRNFHSIYKYVLSRYIGTYLRYFIALSRINHGDFFQLLFARGWHHFTWVMVSVSRVFSLSCYRFWYCYACSKINNGRLHIRLDFRPTDLFYNILYRLFDMGY